MQPNNEKENENRIIMKGAACFIVSAIFLAANLTISTYNDLSIVLSVIFFILGITFVISWALNRARRKVSEPNQGIMP